MGIYDRQGNRLPECKVCGGPLLDYEEGRTCTTCRLAAATTDQDRLLVLERAIRNAYDDLRERQEDRS